ncbi:hypothetical protein [Streptomyces jeddahensis]|nr:hypothetical protein [Streptomyces jeddahensis]
MTCLRARHARDIHRHPELAGDDRRTSALVAERHWSPSGFGPRV